MHIATRVQYLLRGAVAMALLTSCSNGYSPATESAGNGGAAVLSGFRQPAIGNSPQTALFSSAHAVQFPTTSPPAFDAKAAKLPGNLVYVANWGSFWVTVFDAKGKSLGTIAYIAFPSGMVVDSGHNLWVTQSGWPNDHRFPQMPTVLKFKRGETTASKTLLDPAGEAVDVTICPNGSVYVANIFTFENGSVNRHGSGNIAVYAGGSTRPTGTLQYPSGFGLSYWNTVTCDAAGNVFAGIANANFTVGSVVEFPGGKQSGAIQIINTLVPQGIKPDNAGDLLVNDYLTGSVCEYTEAGKPTGTCVNAPGWTLFSVRKDSKEILGGSYAGSETQSLQFPGGQTDQVYPGSTWYGNAYDPSQNF